MNRQTALIFLILFSIFVIAEHRRPIQRQIRASICQLSFVNSNSEKVIGTGFFTTPQQFLTNFHVVENAQNVGDITLSQPQEKQNRPIHINQALTLSAENDLALLEFSPPVSTYLPLRDTPIQTDETVFISGYPGGNFSEMESIGGVKNFKYFNHIPVNYHDPLEGISGSPVFDQKGQAVSVVSAVGRSHVHTIDLRHIQNLLNNASRDSYKNYYQESVQEEIKKLIKRAQAGHPHAQYIAGHRLLLEGNISSGLFWLTRSAEQGHIQAQYQIGVAYYFGKYFNTTFSKDTKKGLFWLQQAIEQNHPLAQFTLGSIYYYGLDVKKDLQKGIYWYKKSAEQGYIEAQLVLGSFHLPNGDITIAMDWFKKSAEQGHPHAKKIMNLMEVQ